MMIMPPEEITKYVSYDLENKKWIHDPDMPKELERLFEEFVINIEQIKDENKRLK